MSKERSLEYYSSVQYLFRVYYREFESSFNGSHGAKAFPLADLAFPTGNLPLSLPNSQQLYSNVPRGVLERIFLKSLARVNDLSLSLS